MRIACWIPKATNTNTGCVILVAFPLHQWLHERALVLCYTYIARLVIYMNIGTVAVLYRDSDSCTGMAQELTH